MLLRKETGSGNMCPLPEGVWSQLLTKFFFPFIRLSCHLSYTTDVNKNMTQAMFTKQWIASPVSRL